MQSFTLQRKNKQIWDQKMSCLGIFGLAFEKTIVIFEISTFRFVIMQSFILNKKDKFGCKIALLGIFGLYL